MPSALTLAASALSPETTSTGTLPDARSCPMTVNPSGPGIARSSRTRSGRSSRKRFTAVRPSYAVMTWWPSVPTRAVIAPTIAGSSSTTRILRGRVPITAAVPAFRIASHRDGRGKLEHEPRASRAARLAPQSTVHGFREPPRRVQPDAGPARGGRLAARIRLEDPLPPLGRDPGTRVFDADVDDALHDPPPDLHARVGRRVLHRVLEQVLEHLAQARGIGENVEAPRPHDRGAVSGEQRRQLHPELADGRREVHGLDRRGLVGDHAHGREDGVDEPVQPLDLVERARVPRGARRPALRVTR